MANTVKAKVVDNELIITIALEKKPELSKSQKTRIAATTGGFVETTAKHPKGGIISVSVNAIIPKG